MWVTNAFALAMLAGLSNAHQMEFAQTNAIEVFAGDEAIQK